MEKNEKIANNPKAFYNYIILEKLEVGISLMGYEVKSIRLGHISLKESYIKPVGSELWLMGCHIKPYAAGGQFLHIEALRDRKLLLHKNELKKWVEKVAQKGLAIIPLSLYFRHNKAKLEIGLGKGKKLHDKRESLKQKTIKLELDKAKKYQ